MTADLRAAARTLRADGHTYRAIAAALGVSTATAWALCRDTAAARGRGRRRGERHPAAKMSTSDVLELRRQVPSGVSVAALARQHRVTVRSIYAAVQGRWRWAWLVTDVQAAG